MDEHLLDYFAVDQGQEHMLDACGDFGEATLGGPQGGGDTLGSP